MRVMRVMRVGVDDALTNASGDLPVVECIFTEELTHKRLDGIQLCEHSDMAGSGLRAEPDSTD